MVGLGALTSHGDTTAALWDGVKSGRVAIGPIQRITFVGEAALLGAEVRQQVGNRHPGASDPDFYERGIDFALQVAKEALDRAAAVLDAVPPSRWAVVVANSMVGLATTEEAYRLILSGEPPRPASLAFMSSHAVAETLSAAFHLMGPVLTWSGSCSTGSTAVGAAAELVRDGHADAALVVGAETFVVSVLAALVRSKLLSPEPVSPFSAIRAGLSPGEGAGALILVSEKAAAAAGLPLLAEIRGYGLSADGFDLIAPHPLGEGAARAIGAALASGGVEPRQVDYVNAHGTGTRLNDRAETLAVKLGLGERARQIAVTSTKGSTGHLGAIAGVVEAIVTIRALEEQIAPPTAGRYVPDPACDLDYLPDGPREMPLRVALSNNFGFGGANASLVLARPDAIDSPPLRRRAEPVALTGLGALSCAGAGWEALATAFRAGVSLPVEENDLRVGRIPSEAGGKPEEARRVDRFQSLTLQSVRQALAAADLPVVDGDGRQRVGVVMGTAYGPLESREIFLAPFLRSGLDGIRPTLFPRLVVNSAAGLLAIEFGLLGPNSTLSTEHASGAAAVGHAFDLLTQGHADALVCVATDALTPTLLSCYSALGLASAKFALSEASVAVLMEPLSVARERGVPVLGRVLGWACASDALGVGNPDPRGRGLERAMRQALKRARVSPAEVDAVWLAAGGHPVLDRAEEDALDRLFGRAPLRLATKAVVGESMGAGGLLNLVLALADQFHEPASKPGVTVINSSTWGGTHVALVVALGDAGSGESGEGA